MTFIVSNRRQTTQFFYLPHKYGLKACTCVFKVQTNIIRLKYQYKNDRDDER